MLGRIVGAIVTSVVGLGIAKIVFEETQKAQIQATQVQSALLELMPILFVLACILPVLGIVMSVIRETKTDEYLVDWQVDKKKDDTKKQTYEEYVRERLRIERIMKYGWLGGLW